jgi:hypothetical protein
MGRHLLLLLNQKQERANADAIASCENDVKPQTLTQKIATG